jgi:hypothetical protein
MRPSNVHWLWSNSGKPTPSSMFCRDPPPSDRVRRPRLRPWEPTPAT